MAKRISRRSSRELSYYVPFWFAPLVAFVFAPFYFHASTKDISEVSDNHALAVVVMLFAISSLSILGVVLDRAYNLPGSFPWIVLAIQIVLMVGAGLQPIPPNLETVPHQALRKQSLLPRVLDPVPASAPPTGNASPEIVSGKTSSESFSQITAWPNEVVDKHSGLRAWTKAGDGYCEDGDNREEFSSSHAAGKTLEACSAAGIAASDSIAFDITPSGDCDIRFPIGVIGMDTDGYEWFPWGAGMGSPIGSGKQKHLMETHCYVKVIATTTTPASLAPALTSVLHPQYAALIKEYSFRPVRTQTGQQVNIILVHSPFQNSHEEQLYERHKNELLFIGISSLEDFPLPPPNPFSAKFPKDKYVGLFPGFLNMYRHPEEIYPSHVKYLDMSQSDFCLPGAFEPMEKKWDFTFSGSDQDIGNAMESECVGWSMFAKNWSFAKQALEVMCGELGMTGVLVATRSKDDKRRCSIPKVCEGKILQTTYISQDQFWLYVRQSRFLFLPQMHDASPRVSAQALALDVPLLMNKNLIGGWKYVTEKSGEYFNDMSDFRESATKIVRNAQAGGVYEPRKWVLENYGDENSGLKLKKWIDDKFPDRVKLPEGTRLLIPNS